VHVADADAVRVGAARVSATPRPEEGADAGVRYQATVTIPMPKRDLVAVDGKLTALLVASLAVAGCGRSQPDQPTTPPTGPPVTAAPTPTSPPEPVPEPPQILGVRMLPQPSEQEGGWLLVADLVVVEVTATQADRARLVHTPTGTEAARYAKVVAQDTTAADGQLYQLRSNPAWGSASPATPWPPSPPHRRPRLPRVGARCPPRP
jgi:hypothetical protein